MNKNFNRYILYKSVSMVAFAAPLAVLFGVNYTAYVTNPAAGISFIGYLLIMFCLLGFRNKITQYATKNVFTSICIIVFILSILMAYLATQLMLISGVSLIGCVISGIFEKPACVFWSRSRVVGDNGAVKKIKSRALSHKEAWTIAYIGEEFADD